jgi:hypothetical protein
VKITSVLVLVVVVFVMGLVAGLQLGSSGSQDTHMTTELQQQSSGEPKPVPGPTLPTTLAQVSAQASAAPAELTQLQNRVMELEQQLADRTQMLELATQRLEETDPPEMAGSDVKRSLTRISLQQAQSFLPEPFASLMAKQQGRAVDYLNQHQAEEIDGEWAYDVEQKVRDYFAAHENAAQVKLSSVSCKSSICEIRGYQYEPHSFTEIYNNMASQSWWRYGSSYSFQGGDKQEAYFYLLAELTR